MGGRLGPGQNQPAVLCSVLAATFKEGHWQIGAYPVESDWDSEKTGDNAMGRLAELGYLDQGSGRHDHL